MKSFTIALLGSLGFTVEGPRIWGCEHAFAGSHPQIPTTIHTPTLNRPPTQTVQPGYKAYEKAGILDFVFIYNSKMWWQDNVDENAILKHNTIDYCLINQGPSMGAPMSERYYPLNCEGYPKIICLRRWWVAEYANLPCIVITASTLN